MTGRNRRRRSVAEIGVQDWQILVWNGIAIEQHVFRPLCSCCLQHREQIGRKIIRGVLWREDEPAVARRAAGDLCGVPLPGSPCLSSANCPSNQLHVSSER